MRNLWISVSLQYSAFGVLRLEDGRNLLDAIPGNQLIVGWIIMVFKPVEIGALLP